MFHAAINLKDHRLIQQQQQTTSLKKLHFVEEKKKSQNGITLCQNFLSDKDCTYTHTHETNVLKGRRAARHAVQLKQFQKKTN